MKKTISLSLGIETIKRLQEMAGANDRSVSQMADLVLTSGMCGKTTSNAIKRAIAATKK